MQGREELFERERHKEPVAGWHCCELACANAVAAERQTDSFPAVVFSGTEPKPVSNCQSAYFIFSERSFEFMFETGLTWGGKPNAIADSPFATTDRSSLKSPS
jgi:hypothetical protein